jgi:transposase
MLENKGHMGLRVRYSDEYIARALEMVRTSGSVTRTAKELRVARSMLYRWIDKAKLDAPAAGAAPAGAAPAAGARAVPPSRSKAAQAGADSAEVLRLRKEVERLNLDIDILKKAALILGSPAPSKHGA